MRAYGLRAVEPDRLGVGDGDGEGGRGRSVVGVVDGYEAGEEAAGGERVAGVSERRLRDGVVLRGVSRALGGWGRWTLDGPWGRNRTRSACPLQQ
jgi:hypothetical protein